MKKFWYTCEITVLCSDIDGLVDQLTRLRLEGKVCIEKYGTVSCGNYLGLYIVYRDLDEGEENLFGVLRELGCKVERYGKEGRGDVRKVLGGGMGR